MKSAIGTKHYKWLKRLPPEIRASTSERKVLETAACHVHVWIMWAPQHSHSVAIGVEGILRQSLVQLSNARPASGCNVDLIVHHRCVVLLAGQREASHSHVNAP